MFSSNENEKANEHIFPTIKPFCKIHMTLKTVWRPFVLQEIITAISYTFAFPMIIIFLLLPVELSQDIIQPDVIKFISHKLNPIPSSYNILLQN